MTLDASGNLGVGTTSSLKAVTSASNTTTNYQFTARDTRSMAINVGGGIAFEGNDGSIADRAFSAIIGAKENATSGNYAGYLAFYSRANGSSPTESARITSDGYLRLAGAGIQFNGDTAAANALDDYEQGTWTPTVAGDTVAGTYELSLAQAIYTKIGNLVTVCCQVTLAGSVTGGGTGEFNITGLPFAANSDSNRSQRGTASTSGVEIAAGKTFLVSAPAATGSTRVVLLACGDGVAQSLVPISAVGVNDNIVVQMTYFT
jgi:hypothetical protein